MLPVALNTRTESCSGFLKLPRPLTLPSVVKIAQMTFLSYIFNCKALEINHVLFLFK